MFPRIGFFWRHASIALALFAQAEMQMASATELILRDEQLAQTPNGRQQLKYLVSCALPADVTVIADVDNQRFSFAGSMGLAPGWTTQPLSPSEQRRVSACMLTRTNYFGAPVQISIRSDAKDVPASLQADDAEKRDYPFFEAGFFGNLFQEHPAGYVCIGEASPKRELHLRRMLRVCSLPSTAGQYPQGFSRCGFIITGSCANAPFQQKGTDYSDELLKVHLPAPKY